MSDHTDPLNQYQQGIPQITQVPQQLPQVPQQQFYHAPPGSLPPNHLAELNKFWQKQYKEIETTKTFKNHELPLARIKKIMKSDEDVRMISAEAPILFAKACEMFIIELTVRAWIHTEESKRRTLQRNDIATAISKTDIFDFLIDIVPREDGKPAKKDLTGRSMLTPEQIASQQYLTYMLAQQQVAMAQNAAEAQDTQQTEGETDQQQYAQQQTQMYLYPQQMQYNHQLGLMQQQMQPGETPQQETHEHHQQYQEQQYQEQDKQDVKQEPEQVQEMP